jgi:hypothetical protein
MPKNASCMAMCAMASARELRVGPLWFFAFILPVWSRRLSSSATAFQSMT